MGADDRPVDRAAPARRVPAPRAGGSPRGRAPLPVAAGVAACWAALTSYLPVAHRARAGAARRGRRHRDRRRCAPALAGWLLGHGVPLHTDAGPLGLAPLALTVLALWRLTRAGVHVSRAIGARDSRSPRQALLAAGAVGIAYALLGALARGAGRHRRAECVADPGRASRSRCSARSPRWSARSAPPPWPGCSSRGCPGPVRDGVRTGLVAGLLLLGAGAGAAGLAVATGGGDAADMIGAYRTGVAGQAGITLVSLAYAPNAAVWSTSYLLGPGFAVGDRHRGPHQRGLGRRAAGRTAARRPAARPGGRLRRRCCSRCRCWPGWPPAGCSPAGVARLAGPERAAQRWAALLAPAALAGPVAGAAARRGRGGLRRAARRRSAGPGRAGGVAGAGRWRPVVIAVGALLGAAATRALTRGPAQSTLRRTGRDRAVRRRGAGTRAGRPGNPERPVESEPVRAGRAG